MLHAAGCTKTSIAIVGPWRVKGRGDDLFPSHNHFPLCCSSTTLSFVFRNFINTMSSINFFKWCKVLEDHEQCMQCLQGKQPTRVINKLSVRKLQRYIDVDTTNFFARWVRVPMFEKTMQWHGINAQELIVFWKQAVH